MNKNSGHEKAPVAPTARALRINVVINQENNVMSNNSTVVSAVIPFSFDKQQVRTLLIEEQPWFVANDVSVALLYSEASAMTRQLDDDEKGLSIVQTPGGAQEMLVINESGLYSAILRSRKAEAKRFKKWVTSEVLPAIRKHGRYEDRQAKMPTLIDELIGMSELSVIKGLIRDKSKSLPSSLRHSFVLTMHNRLHTRFNVPRTELIPAGQFEAACTFIAAYRVLEGEFIEKEQPQLQLPLSIHYPIEALAARREGMLVERGSEKAWLDVTLHDLRDIQGEGTPLESLLWQLEEAGYDIRGAWWELRTYRNKLDSLSSFISGLNQAVERPQRYAVGPFKGRAAA